MAAAAFAKDPLLPRPPGGNTQGALLAVVAHAGLLGALALGTQWQTQTPTDVSAELWAAVPQVAAPPMKPPPAPVVQPVIPPAPQTPAPPVLAKPLPPPPPVQRDADIATERAKKESEKREAEKKEAEKREADKREADKRALDKQQQEEAEAKKRAKAEELKAWQAARAEEERLAKQRDDNLRRMMGQAGESPAATANSGTAAATATTNAAPSAGYAGRLKALILSNMVFTGAVEATSAAEVEVRTTASGAILSRRLLKSSGHGDWDEAVLRAIDRTATLPRDTDGRVPSNLTFVFRPRE
jgi:colicin import membrane protein